MQTLKIGKYVIKSWAEKIPGGGWHGLASVHPAIPNTWTGGPDGNSLIIDGIEDSESLAERRAMDEAFKAVREFDPETTSGANPLSP
jgi:hypothetical protein